MSQVRAASKKARMLKIQRAAEKLLRERSIHDVTMKDVAREADVGEATLFRYVGAKMVLLFLVYGDRMDQLLTDIESRDAQSELDCPLESRTPDHYVQRVLQIYQSRCDFYLENPKNSSIYLSAGFDTSNVNRWRNLAQGDRSIRLTTEILSSARSASVLDSQVLLSAVAQNCHAIYMHEIERTPTRELKPSSIWDRVQPRLEAQLRPLFRR